MTQKLLLAESLDLLRQCELKEYELDKTKERVRSSGKYKNEISRLVQSYSLVYDQFLRGVEILNYVRHQALDNTNAQQAQYSKNLSEFCAGKMNAYMDRCENIVRKLDEILLPLDQVDLVTKEGYVPEETLYIQDGGSYPLTRKERSLAKEFTLLDGTYVLTVKNTDSYSIAAPDVDVVVTVTPQRGSGAEPARVAQSVPTQCGWRKVIGVVAAATLQLQVRASGIRDAHVDIILQKWTPANFARGPGSATTATGSPGASPFAGAQRDNFSSDFATVCKPGHGGGDGGSAEAVVDYGGPDCSSAPPQQQQQPWLNQLPAIPDDDLAALANYNVPQAALPTASSGTRRGSGGVGGAVNAAPAAEDPWAALEHLNVPHVSADGRQNSGSRVPDPVEVNPSGLTCKQRMQKVRDMMNAWPGDGVLMTSLPSDKQRIVQAVYALPLPRELE